jgi:hypothetical protein
LHNFIYLIFLGLGDFLLGQGLNEKTKQQKTPEKPPKPPSYCIYAKKSESSTKQLIRNHDILDLLRDRDFEL